MHSQIHLWLSEETLYETKIFLKETPVEGFFQTVETDSAYLIQTLTHCFAPRLIDKHLLNADRCVNKDRTDRQQHEV